MVGGSGIRAEFRLKRDSNPLPLQHPPDHHIGGGNRGGHRRRLYRLLAYLSDLPRAGRPLGLPHQFLDLGCVAQRVGVDFFGYMYGSSSDTRAMRFGKASFMLDWDGEGGAFVYHATEAGDPWHPAWTADLGEPVGEKVVLAPGVATRRFERGRVIVNATTTAVTVTVDRVARTIPPIDAVITTPR